MLSDINNLINIRNFLNQANEDQMVRMTPARSTQVSKKIALINEKLLDLIVDLDIDKITSELTMKMVKIQSTEDITSVEQMDEIVKTGLARVNSNLETLKKAVKK